MEEGRNGGDPTTHDTENKEVNLPLDCFVSCFYSLSLSVSYSSIVLLYFGYTRPLSSHLWALLSRS